MFRFLQLVKPQTRATRLYTTEGQWTPKKRVSRPTMDKIRALNSAVCIYTKHKNFFFHPVN